MSRPEFPTVLLITIKIAANCSFKSVIAYIQVTPKMYALYNASSIDFIVKVLYIFAGSDI